MVLLTTVSIFGFLFFIDILPQIFTGNFKVLLSLNTWAVLVGLPVTAWWAHLCRESFGLQLHMHHDRLILEQPAKKISREIHMSEIESLRFGRSRGVDGFFIRTKEASTVHIPLLLERGDYLLDSLRFYRSELTQSREFMRAREKTILIDHLLSHIQDFFSREGLKAIWLLFASPLMLKHNQQRLRKNPLEVRRDIPFEKKIEAYCAKAHVALTLGALALIVLWMAL